MAPPTLQVCLEKLTNDARIWGALADDVGKCGTTAAGLKISSPFPINHAPAGSFGYDPYTLIGDYLSAYNTFCDKVNEFATTGKASMHDMGATVNTVATSYHRMDTPGG